MFAEMLLDGLGVLNVHLKVEATPRDDRDMTPDRIRGQEMIEMNVFRDGVVIVIVLHVHRGTFGGDASPT
jgi:hypothetical protein